MKIASQDLEEWTDDVSASPLWNPELAPTTAARRTWSTWNIAALCIGMSVVLTSETLAAEFIAAGMLWWQAMITILLGNAIALIPMILNAHVGTRYGISFPVLARASFGTRGANIPAILRAIVACAWFGIRTWSCGTLLGLLIGMLLSPWSRLGATGGVDRYNWIGFAIVWVIQVLVILRGTDGIKYFQSWSAPVLLAGGAILLWWVASSGGGLGRVLTESSDLRKEQIDFWRLFPAALTASIGYWAILSLNIPDFTRYARSQKSQILGQALGLPLAMSAFAFIGVAVASALAIPGLLKPFDIMPAITFMLIVMLAAELTTNMAANVVSPANDFSNLKPGLISYATGGLITAVMGIVMMPWKLQSLVESNTRTWLIGCSGLMGAIGGIIICDYWIIRKQRLDLKGLFETRGPYTYSNGVNWKAVIALVVAVAPVVPGLLRAAMTPDGQVATPGWIDTLYNCAWFVTFLLGFGVYYALMRGRSEA